jgi:pimeloyl-ACP methyl ester carboxylesterase
MRVELFIVTAVVLAGSTAFRSPSPELADLHSAHAHETFTVGILSVDHSSTAGRTPIIFIPALFCGASQWQRQITALSGHYDIHAVTLPGFDGRARDRGGELMNRAVSDIAGLIETKHLDRPSVIGHSLGGTLAILFAEHHSDETRQIVAVEGGFPVAPTSEARENSVHRRQR